MVFIFSAEQICFRLFIAEKAFNVFLMRQYIQQLPDDLEEAAQQVATENGVGLGKIAAPLRAALAGTSATPSVFDMMTALGRDETLARLQDQTDLAG